MVNRALQSDEEDEEEDSDGLKQNLDESYD